MIFFVFTHKLQNEFLKVTEIANNYADIILYL